ncbi:MAG: ABC transporter ATP-binding protein [Kouleothrix sp.]
MDAIEIEQLHKSYGDISVLRGLNLSVPRGQVYGLLGPNGSGKSTLIHLLLGFLRPTKGTLRLFGTSDLEAVRGCIGYLPERLRYHLRYTAREYLRYLGQFSDLSGPGLAGRVEEVLGIVGLSDVAARMLATYSKGMLQRFGIAQALLANPELLLIDEPTSGLDPAGQREMLTLLAELRSQNHTIFLATHFLDEIDQLCDTVGILFDGRIATQIDVATLRTTSHSALIKTALLAPAVQAQLSSLGAAVHTGEHEVTLQPNTPELQAQVLRTLLDASVPIISLEPKRRSLEDLYMRVVRGEQVAPPEPLTFVDTPPPGLFAPPGHPDALPSVAVPPPTDPVPAPGRSPGDTLLRELLGNTGTAATRRTDEEVQEP